MLLLFIRFSYSVLIIDVVVRCAGVELVHPVLSPSVVLDGLRMWYVDTKTG